MEYDSEGKNVAALWVGRPGTEELGRHVARSATLLEEVCFSRELLRHAHVYDNCPPAFSQHYIFHLEVAVHQSPGVQVGQRGKQLAHEADDE